MQLERDLMPKDTLHMRVEVVLIAKDTKLRQWEKALTQKGELPLPKQLTHTQRGYRQQHQELMVLTQRGTNLPHQDKDLTLKVLKLLLLIPLLTRKVETPLHQENVLMQKEMVQ